MKVSLCNRLLCILLFIPRSKHWYNVVSQAQNTFPTCGCKHHTGVQDTHNLSCLLAQQQHKHPRHELEGIQAVLTQLCMSQEGNNTAPSEAWKHQTSWSGKINFEAKEEPPHHHPDIMTIEMDAGIFLTLTAEACPENTSSPERYGTPLPLPT